MHNSRLDRILYIQQVLVQGGVLNKQQTADRFGVSEKTIQRDLDTLRNLQNSAGKPLDGKRRDVPDSG